ncbi:MAG TPA: phytanoyl-CoA dioxygenase family protein [Gammaproteobacteria bacterium]|jgi:ectoine hydroxylase-related dioxygenase (phytanoyl-CoA dioxygenase family)|nr:phytanoyl-CoA dioxygenase family protein [Gammaproteobacteria bacterium]HBK76679.1 phytanoyl-CoA dioxygenase [Gammaproteobacteria bacterium]HIA42456.1 phytanoyl-CoA dioxygenase family protein [Gammaproteobacteria bacterium]HIB07249.1 phytanoyl-CoA dioxygenase family protein [Gammaproteobacteria bacterium]HIB81467.1 phytanoyl-CoA dioxygenase family protein [Gammaproteobacteria bacterium]
MGKNLTDLQVSQFQETGFLPAFPVLSADHALHLRANLESFEAENDGVLTGSLRFKNHLLFKWLSDLIRSPRILDVVEDIIGPDIMVWSTDWWIKEANSPQFVSWHQDSQYWGLDTDKLVTVWVALSPSTIESGCMRVLPGSHLGPDLAHEETYHNDNMLTRGQSIDDINEDKAVNLVVDTGQAVLFAFRIAHASYPNKTDDRRVGLAIRYIPPDTQQQYSDQDSAALVRGVDNHQHFELEPEPRYDFDPVAVAFHKESEEIRRQILYHGTNWTTHRT